MTDLKQIWNQNESLSENIIVLTQSILIQGWQRTTSQIFYFTDSNRVFWQMLETKNLLQYLIINWFLQPAIGC